MAENGQAIPAEIVGSGPLAIVTKSEMATLIEFAKANPRNVPALTAELEQMVTQDIRIAEKCHYMLKRRDRKTGKVKRIEGPSIRFAEMLYYQWGNIKAGSRTVEVGETHITAQGVCMDAQKLVFISTETRRSIVTRGGQRYSEDMVNMTANAAGALAKRNAVLQVIPAVFYMPALNAARKVALGDISTLRERIDKSLKAFAELGVSQEAIEKYLETPIAAMTLHDLSDLRMTYHAIEDGLTTPEEAFGEFGKIEPPTGRTKILGKKPETTEEAKPQTTAAQEAAVGG